MAADDFFVDLFETAIGEDEILTEVRIPKHTGWGAHYEKFVRVAHQWPIVAVAATVKADGGTISEARVGLTNMGSTPLRARAVEAGPGRAAGHRRGGPRGGRAGGRGHQPALGPQRRRRLPPAPRHGAHPPRRARRRRELTRVDLTHTFTVPAPRRGDLGALPGHRVAWPECFPGATVTSVEGDTFAGHRARSSSARSRWSTTAPARSSRRTRPPTGSSSTPRARTSAATAPPAPRSPLTMTDERRLAPTSTCSPTSRSPASRRSSAAA